MGFVCLLNWMSMVNVCASIRAYLYNLTLDQHIAKRNFDRFAHSQTLSIMQLKRDMVQQGNKNEEKESAPKENCCWSVQNSYHCTYWTSGRQNKILCACALTQFTHRKCYCNTIKIVMEITKRNQCDVQIHFGPTWVWIQVESWIKSMRTHIHKKRHIFF